MCVCAAIWLGHLPALIENEPSWIVITVLMVSQPSAAGSLSKGLLRITGTLVAGITAIVLFGLFSQDPPLLLASLLAVQLAGAYGFSGTKSQYAWFCFAFTTAIILGGALSGSGPVETVAFQRVTMVALGLLIVFLADMLLWPAQAKAALRKSLSARAREIGGALRRAILGERNAIASVSPLAGQLGQIEAARAEIGVTETRVQALRNLAILLEATASRIRSLGSPGDAGSKSGDSEDGVARHLLTFADAIDEAFAGAASALERAELTSQNLADLDAAARRAQTELEALAGDAPANPLLASRMPVLEDLVQLLRALDSEFEGLLDEGGQGREPSASLAGANPGLWPQLDPFRMQIALRTAIAVGAALLIPMSLGWSLNTTVAPIAFMLASIPTRGGAAKTVPVLVAVFGASWLFADLAIVFAGPVSGRLPVALLPAAAFAGGAGFLTAKKPQLEPLRTIGGILALLPLYGGASPPTDVYGSYSTMCYLAVAGAVGWSATHLLWPATASTLFRQRIAAQLELCQSLLRSEQPDADAATRSHPVARALELYAGQLASVASLHAQAEKEPIEDGLDGPRRAELLALIQDLFDACLAARPRAPGDGTGAGPESGIREEKALLDSLQAAAESVRSGDPPGPSDLESAQTVDDDASARSGEAPASWGFERWSQVVTRQLAVETWLKDWQESRARG